MISPFLLDGTCNPLFTCRMLTEDEESHIKFPSSNLNGRNIGERSITKNLERFKRNFKAFSGGILYFLHLMSQPRYVVRPILLRGPINFV